MHLNFKSKTYLVFVVLTSFSFIFLFLHDYQAGCVNT